MPAELYSMTGYAQARGEAQSEGESLALAVTLKSVNHRFLDLRWQLPAELEGQAQDLDKRLRAALRRGHVDARVQLERAAGSELRLDRGLLAAYLRAYAEAGGVAPNIHEALRFPGVLASGSNGAAAYPAALAALLPATFDRALEELRRMRRDEGSALAADLRRRLATLDRLRGELAERRGAVEAALLERIQARLRELLADAPLAPERLLQEAALQADRSDISEELTRLEAHIAHFHALLDAGGEVGKKLDFLAQEMHREVNTLLSKSTSASLPGLRVAELGLELKAEVEKIKEQVQNLE